MHITSSYIELAIHIKAIQLQMNSNNSIKAGIKSLTLLFLSFGGSELNISYSSAQDSQLSLAGAKFLLRCGGFVAFSFYLPPTISTSLLPM
jgi:hypothetical protein